MQRIEVTDSGITVTAVTEPLMSVFGTEMRPGTSSVMGLPWDEISSIALSVTECAPGGPRWVSLTVDTTWGEFFEVCDEAEGFAEAVRELARRSGIPAPEVSALTTSDEVIWRRPTLL